MISEDVIKDARILIVDDEPAVVDVLVRFLRRAGYENVVSATRPDAALHLYAETCPDLVILDLQMPGHDGFWLLERLHGEVSEESFLPIIVLTGDASVDRRRRALAGGAREILAKPVDYVELMLRIWNLLETRFRFLRLEEEKRALEARLQGVVTGA